MNMSVIFDSGGSITIQTKKYCHNYSNPEQAAIDAVKILQNPTAWENNGERRIAYNYEVERLGGYRWFQSDMLFNYTEQKSGWENMDRFFHTFWPAWYVELPLELNLSI